MELLRTRRRVVVVEIVTQPQLWRSGSTVGGVAVASVQRRPLCLHPAERDGIGEIARDATPSTDLRWRFLVTHSPALLLMLSNLTPTEIRDALATRSDVMLVDVREPAEYAIAHIAGATLIPMQTIPQQLASLPRDKEIILHCHHGMRSEMAGNYLLAQGFPRVSHMLGGIDRWSDDVDPATPRY